MKESFSSIADRRQQSQVRHDLYEIIAMTIAAVIGNSDGWDEIEDFCIGKEKWLREHMGLELEHGIPSETTFARVWGQIDPEAFNRCFTQWTNQVHEKLGGEVISIDGKTVCGSISEIQGCIGTSTVVSGNDLVRNSRQRAWQNRKEDLLSVFRLVRIG